MALGAVGDDSSGGERQQKQGSGGSVGCSRTSIGELDDKEWIDVGGKSAASIPGLGLRKVRSRVAATYTPPPYPVVRPQRATGGQTKKITCN